MRRIAGQGILQQDHVQTWEVLPKLGNKPFGGIVFAVIFLAAILFGDRFGEKGISIYTTLPKTGIRVV